MSPIACLPAPRPAVCYPALRHDSTTEREGRRREMPRRVEGKAAIVVGGGQTRGETMGNGRATALVLAREGARVLVADRHLASAQDTVDLIRGAAGEAWAFEADITNEDAVRRLVAVGLERLGRLDILHNNVGA